MHMLSKNDLSSGELETLRRSRKPIKGVLAHKRLFSDLFAETQAGDIHS